jgi:hypothetical protein
MILTEGSYCGMYLFFLMMASVHCRFNICSDYLVHEAIGQISNKAYAIVKGTDLSDRGRQHKE